MLLRNCLSSVVHVTVVSLLIVLILSLCVFAYYVFFFFFFFFKQKTAYEIYQCDWSSDVCSSDLPSEKESGVTLTTPMMRQELSSRRFLSLTTRRRGEIGRASCRERV